jgi:hypothetical protein
MPLPGIVPIWGRIIKMKYTLLTIATIFGALFWTMAARAEVVGSTVANCRTSPAARALIVSRLAPRSAVKVLDRRAIWSHVRPERGAVCWVASRLLVGSSMSYIAPAHVVSPRREFSARRATTTVHHRTAARLSKSTGRRSSTSARSYGSGSCPCGGGGVCVGPRGGRYCITSGGNKRYGL